MTGLPQPNEYFEYYGDYIRRVPDEDIIDAMCKQLVDTLAVFRRVPEEKTAEHIDGKWSVREILGHLCDAERNFAYRAYRFSRNDKGELPGFEQDDYVREGHANERTTDDLLDEFALLRRSTIAAFRNITPEIGLRQGVASGHPITVRSLLYLMVGHERRHVEIIRQRFGV
jgi:uncharacterized damage-inducible protein DinB